MAHCLNTMIKVYCLLSLVKLTFTSQVDSQRVKRKKGKNEKRAKLQGKITWFKNCSDVTSLFKIAHDIYIMHEDIQELAGN